MKRVNWQKLPVMKIKDTVWSKTDEERWVKVIDLEDLETQFSVKKTAVKDDATQGRVLGKSKEVSLIDPKKAHNLSIFLTQLKLDPDVMRERFLALDETIYTEPVLAIMEKYLATDEEIKVLKEYKGDVSRLSRADQFVLKLNVSIPRYAEILRCVIFRHKYNESIADLQADIEAVFQASKEVKTSNRLIGILEIVLLLGNYMNSSVKHMPPVHGFKIDFLDKLANTRTVDNKSTLLNYLAQLLESSLPDLMDVAEELPNVERASKMSLQIVQAEKAELSRGLALLEAELPMHEDDAFGPNMKNFYATARVTYDELDAKFQQMLKEFHDTVTYYAEDKAKASPDEFFSCFQTFITSLQKANDFNHKEKDRKEREARRAKEAADRKQREQTRRQAQSKLQQVAGTLPAGHGVMDEMLESLRSGAAFVRVGSTSEDPVDVAA